MYASDMELSLYGSTFNGLKDDFDAILSKTVGNMQMKGAEDAVITLKLSVSLEKNAVDTENGVKDITVPKFKHDISSVMQVKEKMTGQFKSQCALVWDASEKKWMLREIENGQMNLFNEEEKEELYADYEDVSLGLPAPDEEEEESADPNTPFEYLEGYVGMELHVDMVDEGKYVVRNNKNVVLFSNFTDPDSDFYIDGELLDEHMGHTLGIFVSEEDGIESLHLRCDVCEGDLLVVEKKLSPVDEEEADEFEEADEDQDEDEESECCSKDGCLIDYDDDGDDALEYDPPEE